MPIMKKRDTQEKKSKKTRKSTKESVLPTQQKTSQKEENAQFDSHSSVPVEQTFMEVSRMEGETSFEDEEPDLFLNSSSVSNFADEEEEIDFDILPTTSTANTAEQMIEDNHEDQEETERQEGFPQNESAQEKNKTDQDIFGEDSDEENKALTVRSKLLATQIDKTTDSNNSQIA
jgi:hypothetical protein